MNHPALLLFPGQRCAVTTTGATVGTTGTMGATEDTMAATAITPGGDAVAMVVMAATDTTAARPQQQWR